MINTYFAEYWKPLPFHARTKTGKRLVTKLKHSRYILDIGCGYNNYKRYFQDNLIGIDPANNMADIKVSLEEYETDRKFDAILCLGSINFGSIHIIDKQVEKIAFLCSKDAKVFWRQNPGIMHDHESAQGIEFFKWTPEHNINLAKKYGFRVTQIGTEHARIYSEWQKI